jgi:hypothetical protein
VEIWRHVEEAGGGEKKRVDIRGREKQCVEPPLLTSQYWRSTTTHGLLEIGSFSLDNVRLRLTPRGVMAKVYTKITMSAKLHTQTDLCSLQGRGVAHIYSYPFVRLKRGSRAHLLDTRCYDASNAPDI